ncbi:hypothetical protein [Sphaerisporangium perillae]|uniref:hypothetical protein n=1 Tax=Sphaerisporangium perillae TaxID=2935860 RepID=UPI00200C77CD|nr:hypothetical protein [Sphaerisporangium perillae]
MLWSGIGLVALLGLAAGAYGGLEVKRELDRPPTRPEKDAASLQEIALRWRTRAAGDIFPATVDYGSGGKKDLALRVGIAAEAPCAKALDATIDKIVASYGCKTVLRATYLDATETLVSTVGVAVLANGGAASKASVLIWSPTPRRGVRAVAFPGTGSARFRDAARQYFTSTDTGNYLIFVAGGYADGRRQVKSDRPAIFLFSSRIAVQVSSLLDQRIDPCTVRGVVTC